MGILRLPGLVQTTQPQSGPVQIDPTIGADFAWIAPIGKLVGPSTSSASKTVTKAGIAINSGYAIVSGLIPSLYTTTWTECGVVLLDGVNGVCTLSARDTGQAVIISPTNIDMVLWGIADVNVAGTVPTGIVHYVVKRNGSSHTVWLNGKLQGTASAATAPVASNGTFPAVGAQAGSGGSQGGGPLVATTGVLSVVRTPKALTDAQCVALSANHWQLFPPPQRAVPAAAGGTNTPINPGAGALALTGYSPAVAQSANQSLTPGAGSISITGYAPSIAQPNTISPGVGSLAVTGYAPTVTQAANQAVTPGAGSLALTGYAPAVVQTAGLWVVPGAGSLVISGYAPTITQPQTVAPGLGSLAITGYAPTVTQAINQSIVPGAGTLALSGYAPSIAQSANQLVLPAAGSLSLTGYAPLVAQSVNQSIAPSVGSMTITGFAPVIAQVSASPNLQPGAGMLSIAGYAPTVEQRDPSASVGGGGAGDWRSVRDFADRLDKLHTKPTKAAKKLRRKQIEEEVLELLPDEPESRLVASVIAQAVYRKEAAAVARWTPPQAMQPIIQKKGSVLEQAAELEAEAQAAQFDAAEAIRAMVAQWQQNEAIAHELEREAEEESEIEMLLLG